MKKLPALLGVVTALMLSTSAFATQVSIDTGTAATAPGVTGAAPGAGVPNTGGVAATAAVTPGAMAIKTFTTTDAEVTAIKAAGATTMVHVMTIKATDTSAAAVATEKTSMTADITKLQAAINANAGLKADLAAKMVDVTKILSGEVAADGSIVLYSMV